MSGATHHTAGRARIGLVPLLFSLLALGAHGQLLSVPYGDQGVAVEHGLGIAPGAFGGTGSVDWLAHGDLAEGEVLRLHASSETARLGPAVDPDLAYAGRQGWLSVCREKGRWRLGVRLRAADLGLSAREVDFGVGSRGGTVSLATLLGDGWYGALGHGWGRPEPQATWPGSRVTGSGGGQFWALDLGRRTRRYTTGARLAWSASGQRIEGRASGLRPDAPAGWT
ncbi:MAG: hypothetical protein GF320_21315, partial [Armatimonadia bacterium]|nr:hypothetical protein [Armatimonadia bacterium]